jgi:hypothetical protein
MKPITPRPGVAECGPRLDDSIEPWLPEFANRRVRSRRSECITDFWTPAHAASG